MNKTVKLVAPLIIVSFISIILHIFLNFDGLFINLATEIIGIIITIIYVDKILEKNKCEKWEVVNENLKKEIYKISNALISTLRSTFKLSVDDLVGYGELYNLNKKTELQMAQDIIDGYDKVIRPMLKKYLKNLNSKEWLNIINNYSNLYNACINYQSMYNSISDPKQISCIMNIMHKLSSVINQYKTFPDVIAVTDEKLLELYGEGKVELKEIMVHSISEDINKLVDILKGEISELESK